MVLHRTEITPWSIPSRSTASQELCRWLLSKGYRIELNMNSSQNRPGKSGGKGTGIKSGEVCCHKIVSDASKSMDCHQNLAFKHRCLAGPPSRSRIAPVGVPSAWLGAEPWTLSFSHSLSCLLRYRFCTVLLKDETSPLGDKSTSDKQHYAFKVVGVSLAFQMLGQILQAIPGSEQSADLFMWLGKLWVNTALLCLKSMTLTEMRSVLGKRKINV